MEHRTLGRTGRPVSVVGLGTWQLGADWGDVSESDARDVLEVSAEHGVTFFDTADAYGDGRSERILGQFLAAHPDAGLTVATKMGRRVDPVAENFTAEQLPGLGRPVAAQPRHRAPRPGAAALPAVGGDRGRRDVRRPRRAGRGRLDRGLRPVGRDLRPGAGGHRAARGGLDPDHPQRVAAQAAGPGAPCCRAGGRRHHRAGAAGLGAPVGPVRRLDHLRSRRPPQLQPRRQRVRRGGDLLGCPVGGRPGRGGGLLGAGRATARRADTRRRPRWRGAGSSRGRPR